MTESARPEDRAEPNDEGHSPFYPSSGEEQNNNGWKRQFLSALVTRRKLCFAVMLFTMIELYANLDFQLFGDAAGRYKDLISFYKTGVYPNGRYSMIGPMLAYPLLALEIAQNNLFYWCPRFNFMLYCAFLVILGAATWKTPEWRVWFRFSLLLSTASMFPFHLSQFYSEVFTAVTATLGIVAIGYGNNNGRIFGLLALAASAVSTPAAMISVSILALFIVWVQRLFWPLLIPTAGLFGILFEDFFRQGGPLTGYEGDAAMHHKIVPTILPNYSGFDYPLPVGLYSVLLSGGKGLFLFAPGILLIRQAYAVASTARLKTVLAMMTCYLSGLIAVYSLYWGWSGGDFWGPRYFLFASIPATMTLAILLDEVATTDIWVVLVTAFSFWVGLNGIVVGMAGLAEWQSHNYTQEYALWYVPDFCVLWAPLVHGNFMSFVRSFPEAFLYWTLLAIFYLVHPVTRLGRKLWLRTAYLARQIRATRWNLWSRNEDA